MNKYFIFIVAFLLFVVSGQAEGQESMMLLDYLPLIEKQDSIVRYSTGSLLLDSYYLSPKTKTETMPKHSIPKENYNCSVLRFMFSSGAKSGFQYINKRILHEVIQNNYQEYELKYSINGNVVDTKQEVKRLVKIKKIRIKSVNIRTDIFPTIVVEVHIR